MEVSSRKDQTDEALIIALSRGDRTALAELYDRYSQSMLAVARRFLGNERESEDLVHDVFLEMWKRADSYDRARGAVRTWIMLRLRSRALDRMKAASQSRTSLTDPSDMPEPTVGKDGDVASPAHRTQLVAGFASLSNEQRIVLELAYFEGLSSSEIATQLGIPLGTVKSRTASALQLLREGLTGSQRVLGSRRHNA
jgi:RNA polymerase sigma-70 factor (ECF subfamily)